MAVTSETIVEYFKEIDWVHRVLDQSRVITTYRCQVPAYYYVINIEVVVSKHWVLVRALLQHNVSRMHFNSVLRLIAEWNRNVYRARFLLVDDCVVLQAEIPAVQVSLNDFLEALGAVCQYGGLAGVEFATLATNPSLIEQLDQVDAASRVRAWDELFPPPVDDLDFDFSMNRLPD